MLSQAVAGDTQRYGTIPANEATSESLALPGKEY
jgi:hypothetical protein